MVAILYWLLSTSSRRLRSDVRWRVVVRQLLRCASHSWVGNERGPSLRSVGITWSAAYYYGASFCHHLPDQAKRLQLTNCDTLCHQVPDPAKRLQLSNFDTLCYQVPDPAKRLHLNDCVTLCHQLYDEAKILSASGQGAQRGDWDGACDIQAERHKLGAPSHLIEKNTYV